MVTMKLTEKEMKANELFQQQLLEYARKSEGRIKTLAVDHELHNITPEMYKWGWFQADEEYFKAWDPVHVAFEWVTDVRGIGAVFVCSQILHGVKHVSQVRLEDSAKSPVPTTLPHSFIGSSIAPDGTVLLQILNEWEEAPYGVHLRDTFIVPAAMPDEFLEAQKAHIIPEMQGVAKALPDFCKRTGFKAQ